jgi:broad specificity phosphatase PhoE
MEHKKPTDGEKPEAPLTVVFVRHGEALAQGPDGVRKDDDPPLTPLGQRQSVRLARRLERERFDHAYVSPAVRAHDTAQAIMRYHKQTPLTVLKDIDEISRDHFIVVPAAFGPANRETLRKEREAVDRFAQRLRHAHKPGQRVLVVCHGNFIRTVMPILGDRPPLKSLLMEIGNSAVTVLDVWRSGSAVVRLANCAKHLLPGEVT